MRPVSRLTKIVNKKAHLGNEVSFLLVLNLLGVFMRERIGIYYNPLLDSNLNSRSGRSSHWLSLVIIKRSESVSSTQSRCVAK